MQCGQCKWGNNYRCENCQAVGCDGYHVPVGQFLPYGTPVTGNSHQMCPRCIVGNNKNCTVCGSNRDWKMI